MTDPIMVPMNPDAVNYLSWFMSDANNLSGWATQIFGNEIDLNNARFLELKNAAEKSLLELEDDITKIREFLAAYTPTAKSE